MNKTAQKWTEKGVVWLAINSTKGKNNEANKKAADAWKMGRPILNDATGNEDFSPDYFWQSAGRVDAAGWQVEMAVPLSSLRFPDARTITLGRNHRSSRRIVRAAASLIGHNAERLPKELSSARSGARLQVWLLPDGRTEAASIAAEASRLAASGMPLSEIAVLCRTNAIARPVAGALAAIGLPHVVAGGQGMLDRPEVRDVIALLRILNDPTDVIALARAFTRPPLSLAPEAALTVLRDRDGKPPLTSLLGWAPARELAELMEDLTAQALKLDVRDLFFELMNRTRYLEALNAGLEASEGARCAANVSRFADGIAEFCDTNEDHSLASYMRHLDLVLLSGEDESPVAPEVDASAVSVMTIHQAKGLEFEVVFVPSLVEGRLPQSGRPHRFELPPAVLEPLVRGREDVIAEERRLLYVAMTRARRHLYLTRASHYEGGRRWRDSRFLDEIRSDGALVERDIPASSTRQVQPQLPSTEGNLVLSYSAIQAYRDCPRHYWYRYEQRLPATQSAEAVQGVILHETLRGAGELRRAGEEVGAARLRELHAEAWDSVTFPDPLRAQTFKRIGLAQLEAYRAAGGFDRAPHHTEQEFKTILDGFTLHGVIDRIDRTEDGWLIIDYKSGRPVARTRRDLQVALYGLGAAAALDLKPTELEVVYLATGEKVQLEGVGALQAQAMKLASEAAAGIRSRRFEPQPERRKCRLCSYRLACADAL